jgi:pimeloyl-ACP methyl ester carboxylesterase
MRTLTLVLHGTFAAKESWWRLGGSGQPSFADRLENALTARGLQGTVWKPALDAGLTYDTFAWSGRNLHRERVAGATRIASALRDLASRTAATPGDPITLNLIAHSHGGNVALEVLSRLPESVRVGRVVFLGTPLIYSRPVFRVARFLVIVGLLTMTALGVVAALLVLLFTDQASFYEKLTYLGYVLAYVIAVGWLAWLFAAGVDLLARMFRWPRRSAHGSHAYGPKAGTLRSVLGRRPVVLFTSHHDEADLMLQLSVAPRRAYEEWVRGWGMFRRLLEFVFLRPFVIGVVFKITEVALERGALGFSLWKVLWNDYEMENLERRRAYPEELFERHDVTPFLAAALRAEEKHAPNLMPEGLDAGLHGVERHTHNFRRTLAEVFANIREQIRLRHSAYYKADEIVKRLAETFAPAP